MPPDNLEKTVEQLKSAMTCKETTEPGDVVLFVTEGPSPEDPASATFAVAAGFDLDTSKRDEWWHVHFMFLAGPPLRQSIILQKSHFTGQEIFTMGGKKVFIKALEILPPKSPDEGSAEKSSKAKGGLRRIK